MSSTAAPSLKQLALGDVEHELAATRRLLERLPDGDLAWKPHEKSFSVGALSLHIANLLTWQSGILGQSEFDLSSVGRSSHPGPITREEVLATFDRNAAATRELLAGLDDDALSTTWTLRHGERVIAQQPKIRALRGFGLNHLVHHRGQLSVYLRLLDVPLPPLYGPTADER